MKSFVRSIVVILMTICITVGFTQKFEIELEEEDLVDIKKWVDPEGYILLDLSFDTHNHYFYLLDPNGKVVSTYKNYYPNIFYNGFTSDENEFALYFTGTPRGNPQFLLFFKDGARMPMSTTWPNSLSEHKNLIEVDGHAIYMSFDKRKSILSVHDHSGPLTSQEYKFNVSREEANEIINNGYKGTGYDNFFDSQYGAAQAILKDNILSLVDIKGDELSICKLNFSTLSIETKTHPLSESDNYNSSLNACFYVDKKLFLLSISIDLLCIEVLTLEFEKQFSKCYDEESTLNIKNSPVVNFRGKDMEEKWSLNRTGSIMPKIFRSISSYSFAYLAVFKHSDGDYSLKIGSETPPSHSPGMITPGGLGTTNSTPASSLTFTSSISNSFEFLPNRESLFEQVYKKTELQFNLPYYGQKELVVLSRDYFYHLDHNHKEQKLDITRYAIE